MAVADPSTPLEQQIFAHVLAGNHAFYARKYPAALNSYLSAWGLLPKTFYLSWKDIAATARPEVLLSVDLSPHLAAVSIQLMRLRDVLGANAPVTPVVDPPKELVKANQPFLPADAKRIETQQRGLAYLQSGELAQARVQAEDLLRSAGDDLEIQADAHSLLGAIDIAEGSYGRGQERMKAAQQLFDTLKQPVGAAAAQHNTAVALTRAGRAEEAGALFAAAASRSPQNLGWSVTHTLNPGISAVSHGFGEAALPLMLRDVDGAWTSVGATTAAKAKASASVFTAVGAVDLNLSAGASELHRKLLEPRVAATKLEALETYYWKLSQFVSYLTHVGGFILPLALGDTYSVLGDAERAIGFYLKVRDYAFLNIAIERPLVWRKIAQIHLTRGNRFYRDRKVAAARAEYERIVRILPQGGFELAGPLYAGGFAPYAAEHLAFLQSPNRLAFTGIEYGRRALMLDALANLSRIVNNINYLGFPDDIIPIHSWRYLQNVARYFANHAIQAERAYITFKDTAERAIGCLSGDAAPAQRRGSDPEHRRDLLARPSYRHRQLPHSAALPSGCGRLPA